MGRSRPIWSKSASLTTTPSVIFLPDGWAELKVAVDTQSYGQVGSSYTAPAVSATNGITTISSAGTPTGGTFIIRAFPGAPDQFSTSALAFDASAATIKTALILGSTKFVTGDITAGGGALPTDVTLTWTGAYAANVPPLDLVSSVTGGTNSRIYSRTTTVPDGNGGYGYLNANTQELWTADGSGSSVDRYLYIAAVTGTGTAYITAYR